MQTLAAESAGPKYESNIISEYRMHYSAENYNRAKIAENAKSLK